MDRQDKRMEDFIDALNLDVINKIKDIHLKVKNQPIKLQEDDVTLIHMACNGTFVTLQKQGLINETNLRKMMNVE